MPPPLRGDASRGRPSPQQAATDFLKAIQDRATQQAAEEWVRERLSDLFISSGAKPIENASVGGVQFDIVVPRTNQPPLAIEISQRSDVDRDIVAGSTGFTRKLSVATGADVALFFSSLRKGEPAKGVYGVQDLDPLIESWSHWVGTAPQSGTSKAAAVQQRQPTIFPAMPFDPGFDDVFVQAIVPAAQAVGASVKRVDDVDLFFNDEVVSEIRRRIVAAELVIADLSRERPNVMFECGFAHALGKKVIHITSDPRKKLPFDVQGWPTHKYVRGSISRTLAEPLRRRVEAAFADLGTSVTGPVPPQV